MSDSIRARMGRFFEAAGRAIGKGAGGPTVYDQDGLRSVHDHAFMDDPVFRRAYARGVAAAGEDYGWHWRVHIGLWAAKAASVLDGDFVECGVNRGFMSSAIRRTSTGILSGRRSTCSTRSRASTRDSSTRPTCSPGGRAQPDVPTDRLLRARKRRSA